VNAGFLKRRLRWRRIWLVFVAMVLTLVYGFFEAVSVLLMFSGKLGDIGMGLLSMLAFGAGYAICITPVLYPLWKMRRLDRYPDIATLARYGPIQQLMAEIDREVEEEDGVISIGNTIKSFVPVPVEAGELRWTRVLLTRSWLIHLRGEDGHQMSFMRFDSILAAFRPLPPGVSEPANRVVLIDRHGARLEIFGTNRGLARLLAHILPRVPWALTRFDVETERTWKENRQAIIAAVDHRREQFQHGNSDITGGTPDRTDHICDSA
jgi:hypothetical protein